METKKSTAEFYNNYFHFDHFKK